MCTAEGTSDSLYDSARFPDHAPVCCAEIAVNAMATVIVVAVRATGTHKNIRRKVPSLKNILRFH